MNSFSFSKICVTIDFSRISRACLALFSRLKCMVKGNFTFHNLLFELYGQVPSVKFSCEIVRLH